MSRAGLIGSLFLLTVCAAPVLAYAAPGCTPDQTAQRYPSLAGRTIKIAADPTTPPYVIRDKADFSKIVGFDADLARAAFDCLGIKTSFFLGAWGGLVPAVGAGQSDVMWDNLYYTPERAKTLDYVIYQQAGTGALTQAGNPKRITGIADLCGNVAAVGLGTVEEAQLRKETAGCTAQGKRPIEIMTYPDPAAGQRLIQSGRADIMMTDLVLVDQLVRDNPSVYARAYTILSGFKIGVGVHKGDKNLEQAISDTLRMLDANGTTKQIYARYGLDPALALPIEILTQ